ncbi:Reverse transcriptase [Phytophthora palmivora]|uniref:Reverse transcriptase n=1 Tax=Phytophthora palmivora TaxID=4796 RepID=A0A2P4XMI2_9STRA|nr:Reverse transcriptase [Phytophthora palmivora]
MKSEAQALRQFLAGSTTESEILSDVFPDEIPAELPQDKAVVTAVQTRENFESNRRNAGQVSVPKSLHGAPTFCGDWPIIHAYNKLNDETVPVQTPIPRNDVITDSMTKSTIYSALDLRNEFYQILRRESDIHLTA